MTRYLRAANVKDGTLDLSDVKEMNFDPRERLVFSLRTGDVLVTEGSGSLRAVGASAVYRGELDHDVCFQNTLLRLRPRPSTDPRFLAWWCRHAFADGLFASIATGANIFHISAERVRSMPMTYLPLIDQGAIADFLDTEAARIDALIAKKRRLIDLSRERLTACRAQELARLTEVRGEVALRRLAVCLDGRWVPLNQEERSAMKGTYPYWGAGSIVDRVDSYLFDEELLLLGEDGAPFLDPSRDVAFVVRERVWVNNHIHVLRVSQTWNADFVRHCLNGTDYSRYISGSTRDKLTQADMNDIAIPDATLDDQTHFLVLINQAEKEHLALVALLWGQIDLLAEHRRALVTAAVTGELEIPRAAA